MGPGDDDDDDDEFTTVPAAYFELYCKGAMLKAPGLRL